jgi:hypothetical protein
MNSVDQIIKYLDGALNQEEARSFEKELASNEMLREEFEEVSAAYRLIREQLRKRDEDTFRAKLLEVMEKPLSGQTKKPLHYRGRWYVLTSLAASLAIVLILFLANRNGTRIMSRFYHPEKDAVLLALNQGTRGETRLGVAKYVQGEYQQTLDAMSGILNNHPRHQQAMLFYLLASIELDQQELALTRIDSLAVETEHQVGQSISWYTALALVKSDRFEEAVKRLEPLTEQAGPYRRDARRLRKALLK